MDNKIKRPRTQRICIQYVVDNIDYLYKRMLWDIKEIQISNNIKYKEAQMIWRTRNKEIDLEMFR